MLQDRTPRGPTATELHQRAVAAGPLRTTGDIAAFEKTERELHVLRAQVCTCGMRDFHNIDAHHPDCPARGAFSAAR